jgi:hypothetical protein
VWIRRLDSPLSEAAGDLTNPFRISFRSQAGEPSKLRNRNSLGARRGNQRIKQPSEFIAQLKSGVAA